MNGRGPRPKLCYLLPSYDPDTEEHFYHIYKLLDSLSRDLDLHVVVERSRGTPTFGEASVWPQKWVRCLPMRILEVMWIFAALRRKGCRIFYVHYSIFGGIFWSLLSKMTGARVYYWHCVSRTFTRSELGHKVKAELPVELTMKLIDILVTGTRGVAEFYRERFGIPLERIVVLPNEVELSRFATKSGEREAARERLEVPARAPVVLFLHRVVERKGAHFLPGIASRVLAARPEAIFMIVGAGPYAETLRGRVRLGGMEAAFRFTGWIPNRAVPPYLAMADVYLMPSVEEGFPRALLEAMASGLPSVASDVGGVREILPPSMAPYIVPVGDEERTAAAVLELLGDSALRTRLAEECRQAAQTYDLPRVKERFLRDVVNRD